MVDSGFSVLVKSSSISGIQGYSDKFRHNYAYSGIIQAYSEPCVTLAYSKPWYIQNTGIFRTRGYSEPRVFSKPCQRPTMECFAKIGKACNCQIDIVIFLIRILFLLQKYLFYVKKYGTERAAGREFWYTFKSLLQLLIEKFGKFSRKYPW